MRSAKISARLTLARRSIGVMAMEGGVGVVVSGTGAGASQSTDSHPWPGRTRQGGPSRRVANWA